MPLCSSLRLDTNLVSSFTLPHATPAVVDSHLEFAAYLLACLIGS